MTVSTSVSIIPLPPFSVKPKTHNKNLALTLRNLAKHTLQIPLNNLIHTHINLRNCPHYIRANLLQKLTPSLTFYNIKPSCSQCTGMKKIFFFFSWTCFCLLTRFPGFRHSPPFLPSVGTASAALPIGGRLFLWKTRCVLLSSGGMFV